MITYIKERHKYTLKEDASFDTGIVGFDVDTQFIRLFVTGLMVIRAGYGWDGPSGPTIDSSFTMQGSLVHDAGYDLIRANLLTMQLKGKFDALLYAQCIADAETVSRRYPAPIRQIVFWQSKKRFLAWYNAVYYCAGFAADPENAPQILTAP
jgi:hypothetical protein